MLRTLTEWVWWILSSSKHLEIPNIIGLARGLFLTDTDRFFEWHLKSLEVHCDRSRSTYDGSYWALRGLFELALKSSFFGPNDKMDTILNGGWCQWISSDLSVPEYFSNFDQLKVTWLCNISFLKLNFPKAFLYQLDWIHILQIKSIRKRNFINFMTFKSFEIEIFWSFRCISALWADLTDKENGLV